MNATENCRTCGKEIRPGEHAIRLGVYGSDTDLALYHLACAPPTVTSSKPCEECGKVHVEMTPDLSRNPGVCYACKKEILPGDGHITVVSRNETLTLHRRCAEPLFQKTGAESPG